MITEQDFVEATRKFEELEKRGGFYEMAVNLMNNNFEIEAYFLILATWNFALFRFAVKDFNINGFRETIRELNQYFIRLKDENFKTINLANYKDDIKTIFETLSLIKGVEFTGASKIMHLRNRSVFIMWDGYIKGEKPKKYYNELEIVNRGDWKFKRYRNNPEDYFQFLKDMQERFKDIKFPSPGKTFAKAIDEFNYVNITLPIQDMEKNKKKQKRFRVR
jgi:hypothetical protein